MKIARAVVLSILACLAFACDKKASEGAPLTNELRLAPPPVKTIARTGVPDDSVKPAVVNNRGGVPDDSIKPVPINVNPRGGVPDDSIKPGPKPLGTR